MEIKKEIKYSLELKGSELYMILEALKFRLKVYEKGCIFYEDLKEMIKKMEDNK